MAADIPVGTVTLMAAGSVTLGLLMARAMKGPKKTSKDLLLEWGKAIFGARAAAYPAVEIGQWWRRPSRELSGASIMMVLPGEHSTSVRSYLRVKDGLTDHEVVFQAGPIKIVLKYSLTPPDFGATLTVYLDIPFVGEWQIVSIGGKLREGIKVKIGYPGLLAGDVTVGIDGASIFITLRAWALGKNIEQTWHIPLMTLQPNTQADISEMANSLFGSDFLLLKVPSAGPLTFRCRGLHNAQIATQRKRNCSVQHYFMVKSDLTAKHESQFNLGPFHIKLWYETSLPFNAGLDVSVDVPFVGPYKIATASGDLLSGITCKGGIPPWISGSVSVKLGRRDTQMMIVVDLVGNVAGQDWTHQWEIPFAH